MRFLQTPAQEEAALKEAIAQALRVRPLGGPRGLPELVWPDPELAPKVTQSPVAPRPFDPLPPARVVVLTWTSAEWDALHYVFCNALSPLPQSNDEQPWRKRWHAYSRNFYRISESLWRRSPAAQPGRDADAPLFANQEWGRYCQVSVGCHEVLLFKCNLHLNQDGQSLPLLHFVRQLLDECQPELVLSVGTAGGVRVHDLLGDVVVTNAAQFRLNQEFASAEFNGQRFQSGWQPAASLLEAASGLLMSVPEIEATPPSAHFPPETRLTAVPPRGPAIHLLPGIPVLTTDFFEYGTTTNGLDALGCCVEMDDAVIAMVCHEHPRRPRYGFVRNLSDSVINGQLPPRLGTAWAVLTYQMKGLYTSFNGAVATWAMIAGEPA